MELDLEGKRKIHDKPCHYASSFIFSLPAVSVEAGICLTFLFFLGRGLLFLSDSVRCRVDGSTVIGGVYALMIFSFSYLFHPTSVHLSGFVHPRSQLCASIIVSAPLPYPSPTAPRLMSLTPLNDIYNSHYYRFFSVSISCSSCCDLVVV